MDIVSDEMDEPIKIIESFKQMERLVNYHNGEVQEIERKDFTAKDDQYIDMDFQKMEEWLKIKQKMKQEKDAEKLKKSMDEINLDNLMGSSDSKN